MTNDRYDYLPSDRQMSAAELGWLERAVEKRVPRPWVELRCGPMGKRSHLMATLHPIGNVPRFPTDPGVHPPLDLRFAFWLRSATVDAKTVALQGWDLESPTSDARVKLPEAVTFFNLADSHPSAWWVGCRDLVDAPSAGRLWREGIFPVWRRAEDTPVRLLMHHRRPQTL